MFDMKNPNMVIKHFRSDIKWNFEQGYLNRKKTHPVKCKMKFFFGLSH